MSGERRVAQRFDASAAPTPTDEAAEAVLGHTPGAAPATEPMTGDDPVLAEPVPTELEAAVRELDAQLAELRTHRLRVAEVPPMAPEDRPDPAVLAEAARAPGAPPEAQALARAVERGETTWEAVAAGRTEVPEARALQDAVVEAARVEVEREGSEPPR